MELNIKVTVKTPADVLRYARTGAVPMAEAARICLGMAGWTDKEVAAVLPDVKKTKKVGKPKMGRPSQYDERRDDVAKVVESGLTLTSAAASLGVSVPTARAWINRSNEQTPQIPGELVTLPEAESA